MGAFCGVGWIMNDKVSLLPVWKQNCSTVEKLREFLQYAEMKPHSVNHVIIIYEDSDGIRQCQTDSGLKLTESIGMIEMAKHDLLGMLDKFEEV